MPVLTGNDLPNTALDSTSTIVFPKHYPGNQHIPTQSSLFYIRSQRGRPGPTIPIWEIILFVWLTLSPTHCDDAQLVNLTISTQQKWNLWSPHLKWDTSVTDRGIVLTSISQLTHSRLGMISMLQRLEMVRLNQLEHQTEQTHNVKHSASSLSQFNCNLFFIKTKSHFL